jgi:hypothetical protein
VYFRRETSAGRAYLQIVESRRNGDQIRQQVIATLGRALAAKAMVLSAASDEAAVKIAVRRIGPALVFDRLWEETGCRGDHGAGGPTQARFCVGTRGVPYRAAPAV